VRVDDLQIMPNHLHGIVEIRELHVGARHVVPQQRFAGERFSKPRPGTLSTIIRSFKAAVTQVVYLDKNRQHNTIWQRSFYDHVLRDDVDRFFVEEYIRLNPILWQLDADNSTVRQIPIEAFRKALQEKHGLNGFALERVNQSRI
jgi:putative transposase